MSNFVDVIDNKVKVSFLKFPDMKRHLLNMMLVAALCCGFSACDELPQEEEQNQTEQPEIPDNPNDPENPNENPDTPGTDTPDVTSGIYKEVKETYSDWSGNYLITYTTSETVAVFNAWDDDTYGQSSKDLISAKTADGISSSEGDPHMSVVTKVGDYYSINVSNVGYIGYEGSKNSLSRTSTEPKSTDTHYLWKLSYKEGGDVWVRNAAVDSRRLQWNSNHPRFACYTGSQQELTLYRRSVSTGSNPPSADPGPDDPEVPDTPAPNPDPDPVPDPNPEPDPVPDPTPEPEPDPEPDPGQGTSGLHSWYELPVMDLKSSGNYLVDANDSDLYYAYHMCAGNEKGPGGKKARNYTVCYSADLWRTRQDTRFAKPQICNIEWVEAIDVLLQSDCVDNLLLVDMLWQRELHQDAIDRIIGIQSGNFGEQFGLAHTLGHRDKLAIEAALGTRLDFATNIGLRCGIFAHKNHNKRWHAAIFLFERHHLCRHLLFEFRGE